MRQQLTRGQMESVLRVLNATSPSERDASLRIAIDKLRDSLVSRKAYLKRREQKRIELAQKGA